MIKKLQISCLLVGHSYWILGGWKVNNNLMGFMGPGSTDQEKTSVFSMKRGLWFNGPDLLQIIAFSNTMYCATGLNRTSAIFIGVGMEGVIVYNFETDNWSQMADTPRKILWCSCSSAHEKDNEQYT